MALRRSRTRIAFACLTLAVVVPVGAQEVPPEEPLVNFVFASQLGSGIYASGESVVQVYRIPIDWTLIPLENGRRFGVRLRFPATLGFYGFDAKDLLEGELPDHVSTLTVVAGAEFLVPLGDRWTIKPRAEAGYARDFTQNTGSPIYAVGIRSEGTYPWRKRQLLIHNQTVWAGQSEADRALADDFLRVETFVDVRTPLPWNLKNRALDIGTFAASYLYFDSIRFFRFPQDLRATEVEETEGDGIIAQWEIGFALGIAPNRVWKIPVPRVGLSYRFGQDPQSFRLVLGTAF